MKQRRMIVLALFAAALASAQVSLPRVGNLQDANRSWRAVHGIAGNFLLDSSTIINGVNSGVSNGTVSVVATDDLALVVLDGAGAEIGRTGVSQPPALLAVSDAGDIAAAWQPSAQTLSIWRAADGQWHDCTLSANGAILALAIDSTTGVWIVRRDEAQSVSRLNLRLADLTPQAQQSLTIDTDLVQISPAGQVLWIASDARLHWLDRDGNETAADAPAGLKRWSAIGLGWWQAVDEGGQQWALRLKAGQTPQWFALPSAVAGVAQ